jgi:hypothetical protein
MAAAPLPEKPRAEVKPVDERTDDRWVSELPDPLGCLSLSTDGESRQPFDELAQMGRDREHEIDPRRERRTWHGDYGI